MAEVLGRPTEHMDMANCEPLEPWERADSSTAEAKVRDSSQGSAGSTCGKGKRAKMGSAASDARGPAGRTWGKQWRYTDKRCLNII